MIGDDAVEAILRDGASVSIRSSSSDGGGGMVSLAATGGAEEILGIGRYAVCAGTPAIAEVSFEVGAADQGRGIGTLLLEHLARSAHACGIAVLRVGVEADHAQMLEVFSRSGFAVREAPSGRGFQVDIPVADTAAFAAAETWPVSPWGRTNRARW